MIQKFPFKISLENGYTAIITNPESRVYHFDVLEPLNYPSFDWSENLSDSEDAQIDDDKSLDIVQTYLLHAFWSLQRS